MSKTFREEMDKITVSDELKAKILKSAEQKSRQKKQSQYTPKLYISDMQNMLLPVRLVLCCA